MPAPTSPSAPPPASPPDGTSSGDSPMLLAGRYRMERRLAQGGMAEVWLATDVALDRRVAVKWLKPSLATDPIVAERFRREAVAVARLTHPNIVAVHDAFEEDDRQAVVMQLVDGKSLRQILDSQKRLSPELTLHVGACVAAALDAAHHAGFVHRDVKPGNILLTPDGRVLLTDFGIAKGLAGGDDLTADNVMMGTAKYLSPEQVRGRTLDGRADLYSLGLVLYECLAGRVPFVGATDADTALARLQRDPTDLARLRPTLSRDLVTLIHRLLARNPNRRPETGAELRTELQRVAEAPSEPVDPSDAAPAPERVANAVGPAPSRRRPRTEPRRDPGDLAATRHRAITGDDGGSSTPTAGPGLRGRPARGLQTRFGPSLVLVCLLVAVALVVALVLWATIRPRDNTPDAPPNELAQPATVDDEPAAGDQPEPDEPAADADALAPGPEPDPALDPAPSITAVAAFDPHGDGAENDELAPRALADGNPATHWMTECYSNQYTGKPGVGLIASLSAPTAGVVSFDVRTAPFQVDVFASSAETPPTTLDEWGTHLERAAGSAPGDVEVTIAEPATHLLVWFREIGVDSGCNASTPHRGVLGELAFTPS